MLNLGPNLPGTTPDSTAPGPQASSIMPWRLEVQRKYAVCRYVNRRRRGHRKDMRYAYSVPAENRDAPSVKDTPKKSLLGSARIVLPLTFIVIEQKERYFELASGYSRALESPRPGCTIFNLDFWAVMH
ncbi:hypothetical protein EVG20_g520 [Dentipellis fragilis]|uniref:Uncharacterized protein n=1 Tax=Dentipellis fragilis TaxID=205917 RepID=A0A4Y9ZGE4_9AGAM|nr:hypothetical protein EVG20_g520 [Dentipellis fragilis]